METDIDALGLELAPVGILQHFDAVLLFLAQLLAEFGDVLALFRAQIALSETADQLAPKGVFDKLIELLRDGAGGEFFIRK